MSPHAARAVELLREARRVVVFTGSGMSQESGVPTFREAHTGLWTRFDPAELATPEAFCRQPARVFAWYLWRWRASRLAQPHDGYRALVEMEDCFERMTVVTQNVDGLHWRAGSDRVIELHGSLETFRCFDGGHPYDAARLEDLSARGAEAIEPPRCERCGSPIRPAVVWFGEPLPWDQLEAARAEVEACDALVAVGTSGLVYPAADLAWTAVGRGTPVIEINLQTTPLSGHAALAWPSAASTALRELAAGLSAVRSAR